MRALRTKTSALVFALVLFGGLLVLPGTAHADDCRVGRTPEGVFPMSDPDIVMVDEDVTVRLDAASPEWSWVECVFTFENRGPAKEVVMGFPGTMPVVDEWSSPEQMELAGLAAFVRSDGEADWRQAPVAKETGVSPPGVSAASAEYDFWYTFPVRFEAGKRLHVRNEYRVANTMRSNGTVGTGYVVSTGRFWQGNIGHARVTFDLGGIPVYAVTGMFPGTFRVERTQLTWEASDLEPSFDLQVRFNVREYQEGLIDAMGEEFARSMAERKATFDLVETLDTASDASKLRELLETARARDDLTLSGFIRTRLGEPFDHPPLFRQPYVETREGSRMFRVILDDPAADVVSFEGAVLGGRGPRQTAVHAWSWDWPLGSLSREVGTTLVDGIDPARSYVLRLTARDSTGAETRSEFLLDGDRIVPLDGPSVFSTSLMVTVLAGLFVLGALAIGLRWASRQRRSNAACYNHSDGGHGG